MSNTIRQETQEVIVTPAMIEAGVSVLDEFCSLADPYGVARSVYISMLRASTKPNHPHFVADPAF